MSEDAKDLIKKMLTYDPNARVSAEAALSHTWIKKQVHEKIDLTTTLNALNNLRGFRVRWSY